MIQQKGKTLDTCPQESISLLPKKMGLKPRPLGRLFWFLNIGLQSLKWYATH